MRTKNFGFMLNFLDRVEHICGYCSYDLTFKPSVCEKEMYKTRITPHNACLFLFHGS